MPNPSTRRRYLSTLGAAVAVGVAGCSDAEPDGSDDNEEEESETDAGTEETTGESMMGGAETVARQYFEALAARDSEALDGVVFGNASMPGGEGSSLGVVRLERTTLAQMAENQSVTDSESRIRQQLEEVVSRTETDGYGVVSYTVQFDGSENSGFLVLVNDAGAWKVIGDWFGISGSGAEETGQQSSDQVTNRLQVVSTVGTDISDGTVGTVQITVKKAPGAGNIDLSTTTLQFVHSSGSSDLTFEAGSADDDSFDVSSIQDEGGESLAGDSPVLNDPADRAQIVLNTSAIVGNGGLAEGDTATGRLNTQSGGSTEFRLVVPETLSGAAAVSL